MTPPRRRQADLGYRRGPMQADPVSPPSTVALAWRQTLRDFRAGELRLLALAVMLAVAALSAVGFFADRLNQGLARDATSSAARRGWWR